MFIYITEADISKDNGPGINEREFIRSLIRLREDVICIAPEPVALDEQPPSEVHYVNAQGSSAIVRKIKYAQGVIREVESILAEHHISGIGIRIGVLPVVPIILSRRHKIPIYLKTLSGYGMFGPDAGLRLRLIAPFLRTLYGLAIQRAEMADTVSHAYIDWLSHTFRMPKSKLVVLPNGANVDHFESQLVENPDVDPRISKFDRLIGYVGALNAWRNLPVLIDAFARASIPESCGLVIVGKGPLRNELEQQVRDRGLDDRVVFLGQIPYEAVPSIIARLDVAVDLTVMEMKVGNRTVPGAFSQKIPQYLACGVPVVAAHARDNEYLIEEKLGLIASHRSADDVAAALAILLSESVEDRRLRRMRAREYAVSRLSSDAMAARRVELWRKWSQNPNRAVRVAAESEVGV